MNATSTLKLLNALGSAAETLGPDASIRQLQTLLTVALAGSAGADSVSVERKTNSSQASASRNLKLLAVTHGLAEFFLDQADGRRRLVKITTKGEQSVTRMLNALR